MAFAMGARRSHPLKLARMQPAALHPKIQAALKASPETSSGLQAFLPQRFDQGASGSCTAASFAASVAIRNAVMQRTPSFVPSPREVYAVTRAWERAAGTPVGSLPALTDSGAELADVLASVTTFGVSPLGDGTAGACPTPDGRWYDIWTPGDGAAPANVNNEPDGSQLETSASDPLSGWSTIDPTASGAMQTAVASLQAQMPVYTGFFVDSAFQALTAGQIAQPTNQNDPNGGGHAVAFVDFRPSTAVPGTTELLLLNSWGTGWCNAGLVWCSQAFVLSTWEMHPIDEALVPMRKAAA